MYSPERDEIEIDLIQLFQECLRKWWLFAIAIVVCGGIGYGITQIKYVPMYQSTAVMYILPEDQMVEGSTGVTEYTKLANDCAAAITMPSVLEAAISDIGGSSGLTAGALLGKVSTEVVKETSLINVTAQDTDAANAKRLADAVTENAIIYIATQMQAATPRFIEPGQLPTSPIPSKAPRNAGIGALIGIIIVGIYIFIRLYIVDYKEREKYLEEHRK